MYHIAICDDNKEFSGKLKEAIINNPYYEEEMCCEEFQSGVELLKEKVEKYQLVLLDMQMEEMDGFTTAREIRKKNENAVLAFCSGVVMPQSKHFEVQPYRYLLKQFDQKKLEKNITDLLQEMKRREKQTVIEVVNDGNAWKINCQDILYISRLKRGSLFLIKVVNEKGETTYKEIKSNEKLEDWYQQLSEEGFEFAHTSYIVNMQKIVSIVR